MAAYIGIMVRTHHLSFTTGSSPTAPRAVDLASEHSVVSLIGDHLDEDGRPLPEGAGGTIVSVYPAAGAYLVEIFRPRHCFATVAADAVRLDV